MARWRDTKKGNIKQKHKTSEKNTNSIPNQSASALFRLKAFITDMFMIMMPIMYITTYIILDGKDSFQGNEFAHWITMALYGAITITFWVKKGQTPGFKAYDLVLVDDKNKQTLSVIHATLRYVMFIISAISIIGVILPFFRKDNKTFQDLVMGTSVIIQERKTN
ncbi:RDD family protein [Arcobacter sp. 15-2]|uniref:RDD family protein n=1 Tax=Arcobacter sp. 15-2 TaxID=3374109 RepID=UPI00399C71DC